MPIRRKKMDDGEDESEKVLGTNDFQTTNSVDGLRELRQSSMKMKGTANEESLAEPATIIRPKNGENTSQVDNAALRQDNLAAGENQPLATSCPSMGDGNIANGKTNDNSSNTAKPTRTHGSVSDTLLRSSSSSSIDNSNCEESISSDLGLPEHYDSAPASFTSIKPNAADECTLNGKKEPPDCTDYSSNILIQQLAFRLAESLNRISSIGSDNVDDDRDTPSSLGRLPKPDPVVAHVLLRWLRPFDETESPSPSMSTVSCPEYVDLQDKLHRLETDRESLSLHVSVLSEQVGAQSDKIKDLESLLDDKRRKLDSAEEMLHDELSTRSGLETDRLDLLSEISQLKLKLASLERDKVSTEHRLRSAQSEIHALQRVMQDKYSELVAQVQPQPQSVPSRPSQHPQHGNYQTMRTKTPASGIDPSGEIEQLRSTVQHLMSENAEKEQRIEQMRLLMERQFLRNPVAAQNGRSASSSGLPLTHRSGSVGSGTVMGTSTLSNAPAYHQHQRLQPHQMPMDINLQLRHLLSENDSELMAAAGSSGTLPSSASFPETFSNTSRPPGYPSVYLQGVAGAIQPSASCTANLSSQMNSSASTWSAPVTPHHQQANANASTLGTPSHSSTAARQLAAELNELIPQYRRSPLGFYHTGSLPRGIGQGPPPSKKKSDASTVNSGECRPSARHPKRGLKWLLHLRPTSKRSTSAPNLGRLDDEPDDDERQNGAMDSDEEGATSSARQGNEKIKREKKQKSLKTLISKLKRSSSQEFGNADVGNGSDFRRGSLIRATAGPRLRSWSREPHTQRSMPMRPTVEQFGKWTSEQVADWLNEIGLTMYVADCRKNVRSGRHMMALTPADMERELGIKNQLHKKKLIIAMRNIELGKPEPSDQLDYHQVLRWLDDVGLPQFRDVFAEHRIDGALLHQLTVDDLLQMRISSALHHATIARGIQILRIVGFNLNRFIRKFNPDAYGKGAMPNQVQLWSQHCITEWLRSIDLTEFTPNLMCSGIHGALLALEPTFTPESLAAVLQIPTQKTLIRRHLTTHFNQLLGQDVIAGKREALSVPLAVQLMPGLKVKAAKKGFSLARKKHNRMEVYMEPDDLVCPLTPNRRPPSSAALLERLPESISEQMLSSLSSSNV